MKDINFDDYDIFSEDSNFEILNLKTNKFQSKLDGLINNLDQFQSDIVLNKDIHKPLKVTANAGSGKTFCLLTKALKMVIRDDIDADRIVLITFTNKAANEIKDRYIDFFKDLVSDEELNDMLIPHMSTIHSFSCSLLYKLYGIRRTIITESHASTLLKAAMKDVLKLNKISKDLFNSVYTAIESIFSNNEVHYFCIPTFNPNGTFCKMIYPEENGELYKSFDKFSLRALATKIGKDEVEPTQYYIDAYVKSTGLGLDSFRKILSNFLRTKYASNIMGFSDMQYITFCVLTEYPNIRDIVWRKYHHFIVDEAQDLDALEFGLMVSCDKDAYNRFVK